MIRICSGKHVARCLMFDLFRRTCQGIAPPAGASLQQLQLYPFTHSGTKYDGRMQSFHMGVASIRCIDSGKCTDRQAGQYVNFFPDNITSDKGVVSKLLRKSEEQYNAIFWEIWGLILPSIGDLRSIIDQYVKQGPPRPGISRNTPFANYCRSDAQN